MELYTLVFTRKPWICILSDSCLPIRRFYSRIGDGANSILLWQELDRVVEELENIAVVNLLQNRSIISLIGNVQYSSMILEKVWSFHLFIIIIACESLYEAYLSTFSFVVMVLQAFHVLRTNNVNVQMISQGASKVSVCNYMFMTCIAIVLALKLNTRCFLGQHIFDSKWWWSWKMCQSTSLCFFREQWYACIASY